MFTDWINHYLDRGTHYERTFYTHRIVRETDMNPHVIGHALASIEEEGAEDFEISRAKNKPNDIVRWKVEKIQ